jgi:vitamin B12 transporter
MRWCLVWVGILGGVIPAQSQTAPPRSFGDSIVVTASLAQESEDGLPATVDVVEAQEIEARQATAVLDILATLPSMSVVRSGSPGQVTSLFTRGTESNHTLALWNGIELNDPYFGGFNWGFLATDGVERVEVIRGPFSSLYGGDAIGGVVQVVSSRSQGAQLNLEAGENGYARGGLTAGAQTGPVQLDLAGHMRRGDGQIDNDDFASDELLLRADWGFKPGMSLGLALRGLDADTGIAYSGGAPSPNRRISWEERMVGLPFSFESDSWNVDAQLSGVFYDSAFRDPDDAFGFTASDTESRVFKARAVGSYRFAKPGSWIALGAEGDESEVTDRSVFGTNLDGNGQSNWAVFTELYYILGDVQIDVGLRRDENDAFGGQTSPRVGFQWSATESVRVWGSYGEAFAAPSVGELYFPLAGNPELEPETSSSLEVGAEHKTEAWIFSLVGFDNSLANLIDFDFVEFRNVNIGRARPRGVEGEVGYGRGRWRARWNATYLRAEDLDADAPLLRRPRESSNLVVSYSPGDFTVNVTARYVGEREDVDSITFEREMNEAYLRTDLAGRWQAREWLAPYFRVENLTDEDYQEALGFPAPGITLIGGLSLSYR